MKVLTALAFVYLWLIPAVSCAYPIDPEAIWRADLAQIEAAYKEKVPELDTYLRFKKCGDLNAWAEMMEDGTTRITICYEVVNTHPELVRIFYAHEMAHAAIWQYGIPITGSKEVAADELSAVIMVDNGWAKDVQLAADFYIKDQDDPPFWDPHPPNKTRAITLTCLATKSPLSLCPRTYKEAKAAWTVLLGEDT